MHTPSTAGLHLAAARAGSIGNDGGGVVIEVADGGPGMPPEIAAHAFERFYRGDPARSRNRGGSGLGLAIVDSIVGAHGGTVELESSITYGTRVRIALDAPSA
jgi:two-component system OmpR family sensor kinase